MSGEQVKCSLTGRRSYDRWIGSCQLESGQDVADVMIGEGLCGRWRYSHAQATARKRGRLVLNGVTEICISLGEISATHDSLATVIGLQTMVPLTADDTVELQGYFRVADGNFAADHTFFWDCKVR